MKKSSIVIVALIGLLFFTACGSNDTTSTSSNTLFVRLDTLEAQTAQLSQKNADQDLKIDQLASNTKVTEQKNFEYKLTDNSINITMPDGTQELIFKVTIIPNKAIKTGQKDYGEAIKYIGDLKIAENHDLIPNLIWTSNQWVMIDGYFYSERVLQSIEKCDIYINISIECSLSIEYLIAL